MIYVETCCAFRELVWTHFSYIIIYFRIFVDIDIYMTYM